jgi:L-histidine N-alpha-methyltransferase
MIYTGGDLMASPSALASFAEQVDFDTTRAVAEAVHAGLTATPRSLPPWLFYDETGSDLFEQITRLPEYYLTRTERALFATHAEQILDLCSYTSRAADDPAVLTVVELGAGTATKTGLLLRALAARQPRLVYQPIDISPSALDEAAEGLGGIASLEIKPWVANYITEPVSIERGPEDRVLALYIGSSIGNFSPEEGRRILANLRANLRPGDFLLLGTDLAPCDMDGSRGKPISTLLAAYNDAAGVTAAFNRNVLRRLNRELGANFRTESFRHLAIWNARASRIEMHLESTCSQTIRVPPAGGLPALILPFAPGETVHTENSYKFTASAIESLLSDSGFTFVRGFTDPDELFTVTLATTA